MDGTANIPIPPDEEAHSDMGPSALYRIEKCPGSFALSQTPEVKALGRRTSIHAAKGTVAHKLAENVVTGKTVLVLEGQTLTQEGHDVEIDADMAAAVKVYTDLANELIETSDVYAVESRVYLNGYWAPNKPPISIFGTCDFWAYQKAFEKLTVVDYKNGSGVIVDAEDNLQILAYAAGVLLRGLPGPVRLIELIIVQPNASTKQKIKSTTITALDLLFWVQDVLIPLVARTQSEPDLYVTGQHCRFCPAITACPEIMKKAQAQAANQFTMVGPGMKGNIATLVALPQALADADVLELWIKRVRELAKDWLEDDPECIPGWTLVPTRPTRSWDSEQAVEDLLRQYAVDPRNSHDTKLLSPAQMQKHLDPTIWPGIASHIQTVSSGTKLAKKES